MLFSFKAIVIVPFSFKMLIQQKQNWFCRHSMLQIVYA